QRGHDRRDFIKKSLVLAGSAGLLASTLGRNVAKAQTLGPMRRSNRYEDTFIHERKPFKWPGDKTLAVWIIPNVEVWHCDVAHGTTNIASLQGLAIEKEREVIAHVLKTIERATGGRPRGWLGTGLTETHNTLDILAEEGVTYCGDWNADDQPFAMKVKKGKMFSIPYCMEINDIGVYIRKGYTGEQYYRSLMDQFEQLYADSAKLPRVMGIPLHPM